MPGLRPSLRTPLTARRGRRPIILDYILGGAVTALLLVYLVYALVRPERF